MTPQEAIAKLKTLPEDKQREVLARLSPDERKGIMAQLSPTATVGAVPKLTDPGGLTYHLRSLRNKMLGLLPTIGGAVGGTIGAASGAETGPGAIASAVLGAGAGGALGEDVRQEAMHRLYPQTQDMTPTEAGAKIAAQGGEQSLNELGGQAAGRAVGGAAHAIGSRFVPEAAFAKYPILKSVFASGEGASPRAAQHLTAAASGKAGAGVTLEAVTNTLGDLEQEITKLPENERTVEGFRKAVNLRKDLMNNESGAAMMPIAGQKTIPKGSVDNVRKLVRSYMQDTNAGKAMRGYILKRAAELEHPMTYRALDEMRTDLSSDLAKHNAKGSVARYAAEKGDINLAIDNAILDGLRETVYPEMDKAAGKPAGYFENLKGRQSNLITLQEILDKRVRDLKGSQAVSEVTPRLSSENFSLSAHAGSIPRAGVYGIRQVISPTREMEAASKHVKKAFPTVNSLPYQVLFSTAIRGAEEYPKLSKSKQLQETRAQQLSGAVQ